VVIIRDDVLARCSDELTAYLSYKIHAAEDSLYNTPPVFPIWVSRLVLDHLNERGGLAWVERLAAERSGLLYGMMDKHAGFYRCPVAPHCRSLMNVVWRLPSEDLEKQFIAEAKQAGMDGLKGHRSVGGCRASIYNAMPVEGPAPWPRSWTSSPGSTARTGLRPRCLSPISPRRLLPDSST
jgi:phosphoserine aminotransferase